MTPRTPTLRGLLACGLFALSLPIAVRAAQTEYPPHPDSVARPGTPKGELIKFEFAGSKIFPGTTRDVTVYVPRQYDPARPACVYVNQDGVQWNAPTVFDNLIARGELPILIGVFVRPGVVAASDPSHSLDRYNRSYEYDGLGDAYARFLLQELLPAVETKSTGDGRRVRLSSAGNDRAIGGSSSGAIAAFTAAWERSDAFTRVFSNVGTFVGLRGGDRYPILIRKYEPKPLRVFLVDGSNDNNIYGGDWWMSNQTMERALTWAGYDVKHVWGDGGHNAKHGNAVFPDAIRWLWHDWPQPVRAAAPTKNPWLAPVALRGPGAPAPAPSGGILLQGEDWQLVGEGYQFTEGPAVNARGEVFFNDLRASKTYRVTLDGKVAEVQADSRKANGQHFSPDGRRYVVATRDQQILAYDESGQVATIATGIAGNDLVVAHSGNVYATHPLANANQTSKVWLIRPGQEKVEVDSGGVRYANGITLSPDQSLLYVADYRSHWIYSYQVQADGTLAHKQRYYWLHEADGDDDAGADGMRCDHEGRLYVATRIGIQICDQAGRVNAILPTPNGRVSNVVFGGEKFDTLFATCGDKVYKRKVATTGANGWDTPNKPPKPHL